MAITNMMKHFLSVKERYPDCIIFYRLGDFYEMFFEDAEIVSKELGLTLTGRDCGLEERAPMCGVPAKAADTYIAKLVKNEHKVAICDQLTEAVAGKMVERDVVRVITAGTLIEENLLGKVDNNFIMAIAESEGKIGISWCDISTGAFFTSSSESDSEALEVISSISPSEVLIDENVKDKYTSSIANDLGLLKNLSAINTSDMNAIENRAIVLDFFSDKESKKMDDVAKYFSAALLIKYLHETQKRALKNINSVEVYNHSKYMTLDVYTRRNLELVETMRDKVKKGSLLWLLDESKTAMGARYLKKIVSKPMRDEKLINHRLNAIEELTKNIIVREKLAKSLSKISDIERIVTRIAYSTVMPSELISLKNSLESVPELKELISTFKSGMFKLAEEELVSFTDEIDLITRAIDDENIKNTLKEGGFIKEGYDRNLDELRGAKGEGTLWLKRLEIAEKEETGIKNLKIVYSRNVGYCIEVLKSQEELVPYRYIRRQTLTNAERYITEELKEIEEKILGSEDKAIRLEIELYADLKEKLLLSMEKFQKVSSVIAMIDGLLSLAVVAVRNGYVKPTINKNIKHINIEGGRHPIVEVINRKETFVDNDTLLDSDESRTMIITGPNMAGKSTYMRQVAVISLLAHIGSFVPAKKAEICLLDRIFTRIGASDDLAFGQSTFMVEMQEVSTILNNATKDSLVLLDEVGRGTSTFDGMSIAYAVIEYIDKKVKCKTLFSTHYHELTELEGKLEGVKNYRVSAKEFNQSVVFLRKVVRGSANKSFGIYVAESANLPKEVIVRSKEVLKELENSEINISKKETADSESVSKNNHFEIANRIKEINIEEMSPIEAMMFLSELKKNIN